MPLPLWQHYVFLGTYLHALHSQHAPRYKLSMEHHEYETMARHEATHWWFVGRRYIIRKALEALALPQSASILEVGAGTGGNLDLLQSFGAVTATEPNQNARAWILARNGMAAIDCTLPDTTPLRGMTFDLIAMLDVLEHLKNPEGALSVLSSHLKPGGRFLITVPAYQFLWSAHDDNVHHYRRYTRTTLATEVAAAGLRVRRSRYFNSLLFPAVAATRTVLNLTNVRTYNEGSLPSAFINRLLAAIFGLERHFVLTVPVPFGVSLLAIIELP